MTQSLDERRFHRFTIGRQTQADFLVGSQPARFHSMPNPFKVYSMRLLMKLRHGVRVTWSIVGISLALLLLVELVATLILGYQKQGVANSAYWARLAGDKDQDTFRSETQGTQETFHTHASPVVWEPFCYWRGRPFNGRYVNIDRDGLRLTPNSGHGQAKEDDRLKIFMFGGSTMWGANVSDHETIPAYFSQIVREDGVNSSVRNFGQIGYVSTQECIALLRECQRGNIPDIAVFYDGVNDIVSLQQHCRAGLSINAENRIEEFNLSLHGTTSRHLKQIARNSAIVRLIVSDEPRSLDPQKQAGLWQQHFDKRRADPKVAERIEQIKTSADIPKATARQLMTQVLIEDKVLEMLHCYSATIRAIEAIGDEYGFETWFFWQPAIFTKLHLSAEEQVILKREGSSESIYISAYNTVLQILNTPEDQDHESRLPLHRVVYLGDAFERGSWGDKQAFFDICHVSSAANELIAQLIWEQVQPKNKSVTD